MLGNANFYPKHKVKTISGVVRRFYNEWSDEVYESYLKRFDLDPEKKVEELSTGMKVKYALTLALSHNAELLIFFPAFYKTVYKVAVPFLLGLIVIVVYCLAAEFAVCIIPILRSNINAFGSGHLSSQMMVLAAGILFFVLAVWYAYKKSATSFEKVDL